MGSRGELGVLVIWFLRRSSVTGTGGWEERMEGYDGGIPFFLFFILQT